MSVNKSPCNRTLVPVKKVTTLPLLKCGLMNCWSVNKDDKTCLIRNIIEEQHIDCVALTETWLKPNEEENRPVLSSLVPDDWVMLHIPTATRGGGVGFLCRQQFSPKLDAPDTTKKFNSFEYEIVLMSSASFTFRVVVIYRPPSSQANGIKKSSFIEEFGDLLELTATLSGKLIVFGDFNVHVDCKTDPETTDLQSLFDCFDLVQHVDGATP